DDLKPDLLLVPKGELEAVRDAGAGSVPLVDVGKVGDTITLTTAGGRVEQESAHETAEPDDVALLLHTSGTTSRPKQVPLSQRNLMASARTIAAFYRLGPDDV